MAEYTIASVEHTVTGVVDTVTISESTVMGAAHTEIYLREVGAGMASGHWHQCSAHCPNR